CRFTRRTTISAICGVPQSRPNPASRGGSLLFAPLLIIVATAVAVVVPWLFLGIPSGHDFEFHVNSWMEVLGQWKQGIIYPRWVAGLSAPATSLAGNLRAAGYAAPRCNPARASRGRSLVNQCSFGSHDQLFAGAPNRDDRDSTAFT